MTKLYTLTKKIHEAIEKINQKYGLEIDIKSDNDNVIYETDIAVNTTINCGECYISDTGELMSLDSNNYIGFTLAEDWQFTINGNEIKQILNALQDLLGENPEYTEMEKHCTYEECSECGSVNINPEIYSYSIALCHKWLDGLNPMFESEPVKVLEELLELSLISSSVSLI